MDKKRSASIKEMPGDTVQDSINKGKLDLIVLKHMAQRLYLTLRSLEQPVSAPLPLLYGLEERRGHTHRIVICSPRELLTTGDLYFVGFISGRREAVEPQIIDALERTDKQMLTEIAQAPGILSYSSLELRPQRWYNLVLLSDADVKAHFRTMETHRYAAYQLSPAYYAWIRLHSGIMPGGLARQELLLRSTKYYTFAGAGQRPIIRERMYDA